MILQPDENKKREGLAPLFLRYARLLLRGFGWFVVGFVVLILLLRWINPPFTPYVSSENRRLGQMRQDWVALQDINPHLRRAVLAAEDANFCEHWGFDLTALRAAFEGGGARGGSTITQQTVKNMFLWHGRSYLRKGLEAAITPAVEILWPKHRILELYLNIAEFDEGVFGTQAAASWYFGTDAANLTLAQSSALAAVLPNPKDRSAIRPGPRLQARGRSIAGGAQTLAADGRAACVDG